MTAAGAWPETDAIEAAVETAERRAADADVSGTIGTETIEALTAAGFPGSFVPQRYGGADATFDEVTKAVAAVGEGCASAAWIASLLAYNGRFGAYLPADGQEEIWAKGADARIVSSMVTAEVEVEPVDGGWMLAGRWLFVSGIEFADWVLVSSAPPRLGDRSIQVFAVPRESFSHQDTWSTLGMRATASHTLIVERTFIPRSRVFLWEDMRLGTLGGAATNAQSAPLFSVNGLTFAAPILGAARSARRLVEGHLAVPPSGARAAARESSRISYTRAAGEIDAAELLLSRVAVTADLGEFGGGLAERNHRDATLAVEMLVGAVDRLFHLTGTRGQSTSHPMQRIWRGRPRGGLARRTPIRTGSARIYREIERLVKGHPQS